MTIIFDKVSSWPIYEGFFRYAYVLARKRKCKEVLVLCEGSDDFQRHFVRNLSLLSEEIQTLDDVERIKHILGSSCDAGELREIVMLA